jgi:hypothetical protein
LLLVGYKMATLSRLTQLMPTIPKPPEDPDFRPHSAIE